MKEKNEKKLVPAKEIEIKTTLIKVIRGVTPVSLLSPRPDLAGLRLTPPTSGTDHPIFLVNPEGFLQWIPNPSTYNNLFRNWDGVFTMDIAAMPIGTALSDGAVLARGSNSNPIYIVSNGKKRWITGPPVMDKYYFDWDNVYVVPQILINSIPTGNNWS